MKLSSNLSQFQKSDIALELLGSDLFGGAATEKVEEKPTNVSKQNAILTESKNSSHHEDNQQQNDSCSQQSDPGFFSGSAEDDDCCDAVHNEAIPVDTDLFQKLEEMEIETIPQQEPEEEIEEEFEDSPVSSVLQDNFLESKGLCNLFDGSPATVSEFYTLALRFMTKHNLCKEGMTDFLSILRVVTPAKQNHIPANFNEMKKKLGFVHGDMVRVYHCGDKCSNVESYLKPGKCPNCQLPLVSNMFVRNMSDLVKERFSEPEFWDLCEWKRNGGDKKILDVTQSKHYKETADKFTSERGCYTTTMTTDGGQAFKKSAHSLWPVFNMINEISYHFRYNPENVFFLGSYSFAKL